MFKIAVLVSGGGTNLQNIINNVKNGYLQAKIDVVIGNRECYGIERAKNEGIETFVVEKPNISRKIENILESRDIDLIVLAGFLAILDREFIEKYPKKIINIHPSLLPKFGGAGMYGINVHSAVLKAGEKESGCTVHYVDVGIDSGEIIAQRRVEVKDLDTPEDLQKRVLVEEHILLSDVIKNIIGGRKRMKRALISVYDKEGIVDFAKFLISKDYEIISTGGTFRHLKENGVEVKEIKEITGFPEILDGRVKTLHPLIHGGILARRNNPNDMKILEEKKIVPIDIVVVNLYPFFKKVRENIGFDEKIEFIDIGGPTMLRAAAKSFRDVLVISDKGDYDLVREEMEKGEVNYNVRKYLAGKVFNLMSSYDASISNFLLDEEMPNYLSLSYEKMMDLRYGENPHQKASYYVATDRGGAMKDFKQLHGKELSFNNIRDMDIAWKVVNEFEDIACCGLKHSTPCGVALGKTPYEAYMDAYNCDSVSIFGGIVALNCEVDEKTASEMVKIFLEIIIAPSFSEKALEILKTKKNLRIIECKVKPEDPINLVKVDGGILVQEEDFINSSEYVIKSEKSPSEAELKDMKFGMKIMKYVKSNGIVVVKDGKTLGFGNGETNRIWAANHALSRAGEKARGAVLASDAFFPFGDVVEAAAKSGISAIVEPGGSIRDNQSIEASDKNGISLVFTGIRHFKH